MWDIIFGLLIALALVPLAINAINYAQIGRATRRALEIRLHGRAWLLTQVLALLWPVTLPLLAAGDLIRRDHSQSLLIAEGPYRSKILAREGAGQLRDEAETRRIHAEWQTRVNHFYALGAEAEETKDWLTAQLVAENLTFLLETEPPRPEITPLPKAKKKPELALSPIPAIEQRGENWVGFCNICADYRESDRFRRYGVTGICDSCYDETHEGAM